MIRFTPMAAVVKFIFRRLQLTAVKLFYERLTTNSFANGHYNTTQKS